jgi:hypothetical protein
LRIRSKALEREVVVAGLGRDETREAVVVDELRAVHLEAAGHQRDLDGPMPLAPDGLHLDGRHGVEGGAEVRGRRSRGEDGRVGFGAGVGVLTGVRLLCVHDRVDQRVRLWGDHVRQKASVRGLVGLGRLASGPGDAPVQPETDERRSDCMKSAHGASSAKSRARARVSQSRFDV